MRTTPASQVHLLPRPRRVREFPGVFRLRGDARILHTGPDRGEAASAARWLRRLVSREASMDWHVRPRGGPRELGDVHLDLGGKNQGDQEYTLRVGPEGIRLRAAGAAGLRYGVLTLGQLISAGCPSVRAMEIRDWPDFPVRGVMLDISRDKVPTLTTLKRLIDLLESWKINQIQLYTEHTFAYAGHERVWRGASPMTGDQIEQLDDYCRQRCVELVPNQNSFGHMERWLRHEPYSALAETPESWKTPWGETRDTQTTLNPCNPGSIRLISSLYGQLLPHFSSRLLNVGCDETWELGQGRSRRACRRRGVGRVYLDFLMKIRRAAGRHGRRMMFWADIAQQHPELLEELPEDVIPLVWGYEADHPFGVQCRRLAARGLSFYVCPGTSSWCSFGGRTRNTLANLRNAAECGKRHGAAGYLITDWGDHGHRQYLPVSLGGFLYGAAVSWCAKTNASLDVARELSRHAFGDASGTTGRLWCDVGTIQDACSGTMRNRSVLFACMQAPLAEAAAFKSLTAKGIARMEHRIDDLEAQAERVRAVNRDGELVRGELLATLAVMRHACRRAELALSEAGGRAEAGPARRSRRRQFKLLAKDMARIMERHRALWLARNRRGGLASSLGYYRRNLREYQRE